MNYEFEPACAFGCGLAFFAFLRGQGAIGRSTWLPNGMSEAPTGARSSFAGVLPGKDGRDGFVRLLAAMFRSPRLFHRPRFFNPLDSSQSFLTPRRWLLAQGT